MLQEFKTHIEKNFPFLLENSFLIAVSGGIDSVVLTHLCKDLKLDFAICHCNFQLRGVESDEDEVFVKNLAKKFKKECFTTSFDTEKYTQEQKTSIQIAARELRYNWFYELLKKTDYQYVLTAHNANDNLETFLINLARGSGLEGFTGIPPINQKSIRPLLPFSRDEIMIHAIKKRIEWREDKSNKNIKYVRNKVRHQVVTVLKEINPNLLQSFQNTLTFLNQSQDLIDEYVSEKSKEVVKKIDKNYLSINITSLEKLKNHQGFLYQFLKNYGFTEWNDVTNLLSAQTGKQVFSKTHRLLKNRDQLILSSIQKDQKSEKTYHINDENSELTDPFCLSFKKTDQIKSLHKNEIVVDKDLLKFPLTIRKWEYGDYFYPLGMKGSKKISQFFKDQKLSLLDKERVWLLINADNKIIWVIKMRQDKRFYVNSNTSSKLLISIT